MDRRTVKKLIIIGACALLLAFGIVAFAQYTRSSRAKRVVVNTGAETLFSSNYLLEDDSPISPQDNRRVIPVRQSEEGEAQNDLNFFVTVCNYAQGDLTRFNNRNIGYTVTGRLVKLVTVNNTAGLQNVTAADLASYPGASITAELVDYTGTGVAFNASAPGLQAIAPDAPAVCMLARNVESTDRIKLTFNAAAVGMTDIYLELIVTPAEGSGLKPLTGIFSAAYTTAGKKLTWTGEFTEDSEDPYDLDGFNYVISGSGEGYITLSWDASKLTINPYFLVNAASSVMPDPLPTENPTQNWTPVETAGPTAGWRTIIFYVDSDQLDRYDLQFYYALASDHEAYYPDWSTVGEYVVCEFSSTLPGTQSGGGE